MTAPLAGRTAVATGGGSGLGLAIARAFVGAGIRAIIVGRRADVLAEASAGLDPDGKLCRAVACDVSQPESVRLLGLELADEDVSILVNNAGIAGPVAPLTEIAVEDRDETMAVNVRSIFLVRKAFIPAMTKAGSGDIINVASVTGLTGADINLSAGMFAPA